MKEDLVEIILYGSCARGDYTEDSDIATSLAMKHFAIINFVCLPYNEFQEKKSWYTYFKNIALEGEVLYG